MTPLQHDPRPDPLGQPGYDALVRKRQRARATVLALILGAFVILVFAISVVKIKGETGKPHTEMQH